MILILASMQSQRMFQAFMEKKYALLKKYALQGLAAFVFFIIASLPLLYYVLGKYHLHLINRATFEYTDRLFYLSHFKDLAKKNISVSLLISIIGFVWFFKNFKHPIIRMLVFNWLFVAVIMYFYSTLVALLDNKYHIHLPGTVPSFHYFFYVKAAQSVFFGFGFLFLVKPVINQAVNFIERKRGTKGKMNYANIFFVMIPLLCAFIYFPFYKNRSDFVVFRQWAIEKQNSRDKIEVHDFILQHIPADSVILCEKDPSIFPVMATGRKMVSIAFTFSNPYVDFDKREDDRTKMLLFLKTGEPVSAKKLFEEYDVGFVLLSKKESCGYKMTQEILGAPVLENRSYIIYGVNK